MAGRPVYDFLIAQLVLFLFLPFSIPAGYFLFRATRHLPVNAQLAPVPLARNFLCASVIGLPFIVYLQEENSSSDCLPVILLSAFALFLAWFVAQDGGAQRPAYLEVGKEGVPTSIMVSNPDQSMSLAHKEDQAPSL